MRSFAHKFIRVAAASTAIALLGGCFLFAPDITVVVTSNGNPIAGFTIVSEEETIATTNADGEAILSRFRGDPQTLVAEKPFFSTSSPSIGDDGVTVEIEAIPKLFVPDYQISGTPRVVMLPSVDADPADYVEVTSVKHTTGTYTLGGPVDTLVDYENDILYILDSPGVFAQSFLLALEAFPPAADGSQATVVPLLYGSSPTSDQLNGAQQISLGPDGSILTTDYPNGYIVQVPSSLDPTAVQSHTATPYVTGTTLLPDNRIAYAYGYLYTMNAIRTIPNIEYVGAASTFATLGNGNGANQLELATRVHASDDGQYLYISDTGDQGSVGSDNASRIVRMDANGTNFTPYPSGDPAPTPGTGTGQLFNPILLAVLPDDRLYIMDTNNDRIVRVDADVFDGGSANWIESSQEFDFDYWYSSC